MKRGIQMNKKLVIVIPKKKENKVFVNSCESGNHLNGLRKFIYHYGINKRFLNTYFYTYLSYISTPEYTARLSIAKSTTCSRKNLHHFYQVL